MRQPLSASADFLSSSSVDETIAGENEVRGGSLLELRVVLLLPLEPLTHLRPRPAERIEREERDIVLYSRGAATTTGGLDRFIVTINIIIFFFFVLVSPCHRQHHHLLLLHHYHPRRSFSYHRGGGGGGGGGGGRDSHPALHTTVVVVAPDSYLSPPPPKKMQLTRKGSPFFPLLVSSRPKVRKTRICPSHHPPSSLESPSRDDDDERRRRRRARPLFPTSHALLDRPERQTPLKPSYVSKDGDWPIATTRPNRSTSTSIIIVVVVVVNDHPVVDDGLGSRSSNRRSRSAVSLTTSPWRPCPPSSGRSPSRRRSRRRSRAIPINRSRRCKIWLRAYPPVDVWTMAPVPAASPPPPPSPVTISSETRAIGRCRRRANVSARAPPPEGPWSPIGTPTRC